MTQPLPPGLLPGPSPIWATVSSFKVEHRDTTITVSLTQITLTGTLHGDYTFDASGAGLTPEGIPVQVSASGAFAQGSSGVIIQGGTLQISFGCSADFTAQHQ